MVMIHRVLLKSEVCTVLRTKMGSAISPNNGLARRTGGREGGRFGREVEGVKLTGR